MQLSVGQAEVPAEKLLKVAHAKLTDAFSDLQFMIGGDSTEEEVNQAFAKVCECRKNIKLICSLAESALKG